MVAQEDSGPRGACAFRSGQIVWWEHRQFGDDVCRGRPCLPRLPRTSRKSNQPTGWVHPLFTSGRKHTPSPRTADLTRERPLLSWRAFLVALEVANAGDMGTWRLPTSRSEKIERLPQQWRTEDWSEYWERNSSGRTLSS
ncbi:hypothetical protein CH63R_10279 [Colletotrichum higginsianum IMI 349063]|uniref:Uncharacterized protein n=1 Tax=Colletotrichum higginsianum (strain IMI 349063) TaxID=759273 RepID=A0A1B7Y2B9_COLHI|nr:uncharacterized protein CH63R_10279 [Colletotrichum higginsianum IMI 349063]OBR06159.1 hypothetical protein CH63R_10279 [Colletotrichum higginsianum IMI 349063]